MSDIKKWYGFRETLFIPFKYTLGHTLALLVQALLNGLIPTLQIIVMAEIINTAVIIVEKEANVSQIYMPIFFMILLIGYQWISEELTKFSQVQMNLSLRITFRTIITEKVARLNYKHIEDNVTCDLIKRVLQNPENQISSAFITILSLLTLALNIIGVIALVFAYVWWAALLIIGLVIPLCFLAAKSARENYNAEKDISQNVRRYEYLGEILTNRDAVEERTLFGFTQKINTNFKTHYEAAYKTRLKMRRKWFFKMKAGSFVTSIASILTVFIFINPVLTGKITTGFFISIVRSFFNLIQQMSWNFTEYIDQLATHKEYLKDLNSLLNLDETEGSTDLPAISIPDLESIEFKNVRFKYPGTNNYVLNGVSFKIVNGRHYAFVGVNGAGKTTIIKLLTGLYSEYEGNILINGKELKIYPLSFIKSITSVLYQDFAKYYISFKNNILIGNINQLHTDNTNKKLIDTIGFLGLTDVLSDLPQGLDTPLGKIKATGQDLSGGQWQRVALARSIINPAPLKILDEPTASLDPVSESKLYEEFENITQNCTTILISHRLGSTKLADEIFVMGNGKIIENGTHEKLMTNEGVYSTMFNNQKDWYMI